MKFLVIGDIHGNLPALESVFLKEKGNFDHVICHGDVVNYGPWSNECVEFLASLDDISLLKGNHETAFIDGVYSGTNNLVNTFFSFCYERFNQSLIPVIKKYNDFIELGGYQIRHSIENKYIFEDTDLDHLTLDKNTIIGHSHQQFRRVINKCLLYNTGSLGQNRSLINVANYLIFDASSQKVELKYLISDIDALIKQMISNDFPRECIEYYSSKGKL